MGAWKKLRAVFKRLFQKHMSNLPENQENVVKPENLLDSSQYQFIAEMMMSAGPRKDKETELGEDVAGVVVSPTYAFFWIADGTSEMPYLRDEQSKIHFSSRLLAQELAISFRERIWGASTQELNNKDICKEMVQNCLDNVLQSWSKTLENVTNESRKYLERIFEERQGTIIDFSTTFLGGILSQSGTLQVSFYGDSPLYVKQGENNTIIRESNYRFFLRLSKNGDEYTFTTSKDHKIVSHVLENVDVVVAGSDGVGKLPEFIQAQSKSFPFRKIWNRLHKFSPQTNDDKSVCLLARYKVSEKT